MVVGYCMACREKVEMKDAKKIVMKNGKPAMKGKCSKCNGSVFRIGDGSPAKSKPKSKKGNGSRKSRRSHKSRK